MSFWARMFGASKTKTIGALESQSNEQSTAPRSFILRMYCDGRLVYFNPATGKFVPHPSQIEKFFSKEEYGRQVLEKFGQLSAGQGLNISAAVVLPLEQALREHNGLA